MVVKALEITFATLRSECKNLKRSGRQKVNTLASADCKLSVDHITGHPFETSGPEHATFGFRSAPATA